MEGSSASASQTDVITDIFELSNYMNSSCAAATSVDELKNVFIKFSKGILSIVVKTHTQRSVVSSQGSLLDSSASTLSMPASSVSPSPVQCDLLPFTATCQATFNGSIQHEFTKFQCPVCKKTVDKFSSFRSHARALKEFCEEAARAGITCNYKTLHPKKKCRLDPSEDCRKLGIASMKLGAPASDDIAAFQNAAVKFSAALHSQVHMQATPTTGVYNTALVWQYTV